MAKQIWEFTFICVVEGSTKEEAFAAALEYIAEMSSKRELEYSGAEFLEEREENE